MLCIPHDVGWMVSAHNQHSFYGWIFLGGFPLFSSLPSCLRRGTRLPGNLPVCRSFASVAAWSAGQNSYWGSANRRTGAHEAATIVTIFGDLPRVAFGRVTTWQALRLLSEQLWGGHIASSLSWDRPHSAKLAVSDPRYVRSCTQLIQSIFIWRPHSCWCCIATLLMVEIAYFIWLFATC